MVIEDRKLLREVPKINSYAAMAAEAPVAILVCGDSSLETVPGYWVIDCSAAVQNLLLAAHALGLGAVWTGVYPQQERVKGFRRLLGTMPRYQICTRDSPLGRSKHTTTPSRSRVHVPGLSSRRFATSTSGFGVLASVSWGGPSPWTAMWTVKFGLAKGAWKRNGFALPFNASELFRGPVAGDLSQLHPEQVVVLGMQAANGLLERPGSLPPRR